MLLRTARSEDLAEILAMALAFYEEDGFTTPEPELRRNLAALIESEAARVVVVADDDALVAFAITTTRFGLEYGQGAELEDLYVVPGARRNGLANRLIEDSAGWALSLGCDQLELVVAPNGSDASDLLAYYKARGFDDEGRRLLSRAL